MSDDRTDDHSKEPFLSRWARQKSLSKRAPQVAPAPATTDAPEPSEVDLSKLAPVDELTADSDITAFLQKGVPEALQKLALRRMWALDPAIRDFVEMAENQWDFNAPGGIPGLYENLSPGTDVSMWMAQASQSTVATESRSSPDQIAATTGREAAEVDALQQDCSPDGAGNMAPQAVRPSTTDGTDVALQPSGDIQALSETTAVEFAAPPLPRRRHGGALPN